MPNRQIPSYVPGGATHLADSITALFALELMSPGSRFYLISPRLGNMVVIPTPFGQFRALMPEFGRSELRLGDALNLLASRGGQVRVLYRSGDLQTDTFIAQLAPDVERRSRARLDERGLIGERFYLRGSFEFDLGGVSAGDEHVELSTDPADVARALLHAEHLWSRV